MKSIDFSYSKEIKVQQLWAQAYQLYKDGEYRLTQEEREVALARCLAREIHGELDDFIASWYEVTEDRAECLSYREILEDLKGAGLMSHYRGLRDAFVKYGASHYLNNGTYYTVKRRETKAERTL